MYATPFAMNSGSFPNRRIQLSGNTPTIKNITMLMAMEIAMPTSMVLAALSYFFAPMFWALMAETEVLMAMPGKIANPFS